MGGNLPTEKRAQFGCEVLSWFGETPIDRKRPWDCLIDPSTGTMLVDQGNSLC